MNDAALTGILLSFVSLIALVAGFATGEMPFKYKALDTSRETAPTTFWAFARSWVVFAILGVGIAHRHWSG